MVRKIAIMIGSDSDRPQCKSGLDYLKMAQDKGLGEVVNVITNSIHRNTSLVLENLHTLADQNVDVLIAGAGMANHLTGTVDAYLRYGMGNDKIVVVGVAFEGKTDAHTRAARESIIHVPGTQVVFDEFVGENGFRRACEFAAIRELPEIDLKPGKPVIIRSLEHAINEIETLKNKGGKTDEKKSLC